MDDGEGGWGAPGARRALRPVSPEDTAEIKGLPDTYPRRVKQDVDPRP